MNKEITVEGLLAEALKNTVDALQALSDAFTGYTLRPNAKLPRGARKRDKEGGKLIISLHPLDAITEQHRGDPYGELDAACAWITEHACAQLDKVEVAAHRYTHRKTVEQEQRTMDWLRTTWPYEYTLHARVLGKQFAWETISETDTITVQRRIEL